MRILTALTMLCLTLASLTTPSFAADPVSAARDAIRGQEQAFARDDTAAAYSYAAPQIRELFPQAENFMNMVRQGYPPVYRHKSFDFGETRNTGDSIEQDVRIVDADGVAWDALYTLQEQPDGTMKITSCTLKKTGLAV